MGIETKRYRVAQKRHSYNGLWSSEEFLFGITGGAYASAAQRSRRESERRAEDLPSFEETYPKYPFSELVRLSVAFGDLLDRVMRRPARKPAGAAPQRAFTGAKR